MSSIFKEQETTYLKTALSLSSAIISGEKKRAYLKAMKANMQKL